MSVEQAPSSLLARIDRVRAQLDEARTLADVGVVLDDLERLRRYAKAAKWTLDAQNEIARGWFLAQRRGGEIWAAMEKQGPGEYRKRFQNGTVQLPPTMAEYGLTKKQAMYWQRYAAIPEERFLTILDDIAEVRRLTTSALLPYLFSAEAEERAIRLGLADGDAVVYQADYRDLMAEIDDESVDLLLTDPPYSTDVEDIETFARCWLSAVLPKVKRSGRAYICVGAYPSELAAYLGVLLGQDHLPLEQVLVWTYRNTLGPAPSHAYKVNWQAILYLVGPTAPPLGCPTLAEQFSVMDIAAPDGRLDTRAHAWQKPDDLGDRLVRHAMPEGGSVLDPFAGTGALLAAAARAGGRAIGGEIDADMLAWCERRGIEVVRAEA